MAKFSAFTAFAILAAGSALAVDLKQFPPELYPEINDKTSDEITLAGIAALYPGRLVLAPQNASASTGTEPALSPRKPLRATLPGNIAYLRCYSFAEVEKLPPDTDAIIDLRYFSSPADSASECAAFCGKIAGTPPETTTLGTYPTPKTATPDTAPDTGNRKLLVLVNQSVAGPIEAMLADLRERGKIILVGTRTAGKTAVYGPLENNAKYLRITGEIRPASTKKTLLTTGVTPDIRVGVSDANDLYAWQRAEREKTPEAVLRILKTTGTPDAETPDAAQNKNPADTAPGIDMTLRRAHDILVALQVTTGMATSAR